MSYRGAKSLIGSIVGLGGSITAGLLSIYAVQKICAALPIAKNPITFYGVTVATLIFAGIGVGLIERASSERQEIYWHGNICYKFHTDQRRNNKS